MSSLSKIKEPIEEEMKKFEPFFKSSMKSKVPLLDIITNYILRQKGKQMRPIFVFLSAKLCGEVNHSTYVAAGLIELLHTATLIHDDVVDDAYQRRSFFSINALWKSKIAVLLGDYLLAKGLLLAVENKSYDLLEIVSKAVKDMAEGELLQLEKSRKLDITEETYYEIIRKKTATLIASCSTSGAKSVGASDDIIEKMKLFGENVGIAFQIKDDLFDYQQTNLIGKPTGNDIQEKKMTLPLIYALNHADSADKKRILNIIKHHNKDIKRVREVVNFVKENKGLDYAAEQMYMYKNKAIEYLTVFPDSIIKSSLLEFVNYTIERNK